MKDIITFITIFALILFFSLQCTLPGDGPPPDKDPGLGTNKVMNPVFNHEEGTYDCDIDIVITTETAGALIWYKIDAGIPKIYFGPIEISGQNTSVTIEAWAEFPDMEDSDVYDLSLTIEYLQAKAPDFSIESGKYGTFRNLKITSATQEAHIKYTTDGTDP